MLDQYCNVAQCSRVNAIFWSVCLTICANAHHNRDDAWRQTHLGRLLGHAMRRFDERVLALMAHDVDVPLALSNLAARAQVERRAHPHHAPPGAARARA